MRSNPRQLYEGWIVTFDVQLWPSAFDAQLGRLAVHTAPPDIEIELPSLYLDAPNR